MLNLNREKYDWETREDAETLARYQQIKNDPQRLRKAQECIKESVVRGKEALGEATPPPIPGRSNPATIMKLSEVRRK